MRSFFTVRTWPFSKEAQWSFKKVWQARKIYKHKSTPCWASCMVFRLFTELPVSFWPSKYKSHIYSFIEFWLWMENSKQCTDCILQIQPWNCEISRFPFLMIALLWENITSWKQMTKPNEILCELNYFKTYFVGHNKSRTCGKPCSSIAIWELERKPSHFLYIF